MDLGGVQSAHAVLPRDGRHRRGKRANRDGAREPPRRARPEEHLGPRAGFALTLLFLAAVPFASFAQSEVGSHLGTGLLLKNASVGVAYQHLSNAGLKQPNSGINFYLATVSVGL
jgi:hypothetical protein